MAPGLEACEDSLTRPSAQACTPLFLLACVPASRCPKTGRPVSRFPVKFNDMFACDADGNRRDVTCIGSGR